jgi:Raf kinase inhibitor-like YbhB/YbcL family protein
MKLVLFCIPTLIVLLAACGGSNEADEPTPTLTPPPDDIVEFSMQSNAFADGSTIPERHTCDGDDLSPSLFWEEPPEGTTAFVLVMDDADVPAGVFTHWLYYDIPGDARSLPEAIEREAEPASGGAQGFNSFPEHIVGYQGPCPPAGQTHEYTFTLSALDEPLDLPPGSSPQHIDLAGQVLGEATLSGTYGR